MTLHKLDYPSEPRRRGDWKTTAGIVWFCAAVIMAAYVVRELI
jgi:hypothetical protein